MAAGFAVLILLTVKAYQNAPPIPNKFVNPAGAVVFTVDDVIAGQQVFLKHAGSTEGRGRVRPLSPTLYLFAQTFDPFSQMVKLHLGTIEFAARYACCFNARIRSHFEIVIGIPTFSGRPMVVWNRMLRIRKVVRSHIVSFTE